MKSGRYRTGWTATGVLLLLPLLVCAQPRKLSRKERKALMKEQPAREDPSQIRYRIEGGIMQQLGLPDSTAGRDTVSVDSTAIPGSLPVDGGNVSDSTTVTTTDNGMPIDSLSGRAIAPDSIGVRSPAGTMPDSLPRLPDDSLSSAALIPVPAPQDTLQKRKERREFTFGADTTTMSGREKRRYRRWLQDHDPDFVRYSPIFRDTMPISRMSWISTVVPGFGQLYNQQYWKIPVLYGTVGTALYFGLRENSTYKKYRRQYDLLVSVDADRTALDPVQTKMIRHNTARQLLIGGAVAAYIYFIGDAAVNYPSKVNAVKKATTLSMICPGAGQIYNRSYWKVPIVMGGFATMIYMVDWNNRGYKRFKLAYDLRTAYDAKYQAWQNDPNHVEADRPVPTDEFSGRVDAERLKNLKDSYRRNRDLCIILTGACYLLNVIDAHVDAHLKDYDISDDLSMNLEPMVGTVNTMRGSGNTVGFSFNIRF